MISNRVESNLTNHNRMNDNCKISYNSTRVDYSIGEQDSG